MASLRNIVVKFGSKASICKEVFSNNLSKVPAERTLFLFKDAPQSAIRRASSGAFSNGSVGSQTRKLFTPGPLMVSDRVKSVMLADLGVRHSDFAYIVQYVRASLLQIAKVTQDQFTTIPVNGSGCFVTEATLRTMLGGGNKKLIIMSNGRYGDRTVDICKAAGIKYVVIPMNMKTLDDTLRANKDVSGVFVVHCETSSGVINPAQEIGQVIKKHSPDIMFFVDAMTSFGAIPLDMKHIDFVLSDSCKSLQGVPGIAFVIARKCMLDKHRFRGNGLVLDIGGQYDELETTGEFRFTPPAHVMLAFKEALMEYSDEGGMEARAKRYHENTAILKDEMADMGFDQLFTDRENPDGCLLTSFVYPNNPLFIFEEFYQRLGDTGHLICSEAQSLKNCIRIGSMGDVTADDVKDLCFSIRHVCADMRLSLPLQIPTY